MSYRLACSTDTEWLTMVNYLGEENIAGGKLKETGFTHWSTPNTGATNESGFTALPGGIKICGIPGPEFGWVGERGYWWLATPGDYWKVSKDAVTVEIGTEIEYRGLCVRCLKD
jgi:uncharacterized protein (TIGR02145 family)